MALCVLGRESSNDFPNEFWFYYLNNNKIKKCEFFFREFQLMSSASDDISLLSNQDTN